ncbi:MAG: hypothetical protein LBQ54_02715 [Planctomycetaceae bacterium]|nr:hypothetical protein [Planctomycetaceae bacterium]
MKKIFFPLLLILFAWIPSLSAQKFPDWPHDNGGYGGVDALGRSLSLEEDAMPVHREGRYVGLFYFVWQAQHGTAGPFDITKIVKEHPEAIKDANHPAWGPLSLFHHWGEPLFGYYTGDDVWVKRKHVQMLTDAGVDFLVMDATNAVPYTSQVLSLMKILDEYQKQGWNVPKVVFYTNSDSGKTIGKIYESIYKQNLYPDLWFYWEEKPLLIGHPEECSEEVKDFFRIKKSQWPNENQYHGDGFPWIAFERPQHVFKNARGENEVVNVSVAQHNGTIRFSSSAFYGDPSNRTRSFHDGKNDSAEDAWKYGYNFEEQFDFAVQQDPNLLFITGWNEWIAMRFRGPEGEPVMFVDLCDINNSRDIEPMQGGFGDNYYMQMIRNIRRYKRTVPFPTHPGNNMTIDLRGKFRRRYGTEGKRKMPCVYRDYVNDIVNRDEKGYGELHYTNTTGRNDLKMMRVTCDAANLYFDMETADTISPPADHWMSLFLRVNQASDAHWEGYDYVINRVAPEKGKAILEKSIGGWNWSRVAALEMKVKGKQLQLAIPKKLLGELGAAFTLEFKWADNYQGEGNIDSFYIDGDAAPIGRLNYVFRSVPVSLHKLSH